MINGGTIDLGVYLCPYQLPDSASGSGWSFVRNAAEPLLTSYASLGDPNAQVIAPNRFDYGIVDHYFAEVDGNSTGYDGNLLCTYTTDQGHFGQMGYIQYQTVKLAAAGAVEGIVQPSTVYYTPNFDSDLPFPPNLSPGEPNGYILKTMALGPTPWNDNAFNRINFALPYSQYGYFNLFVSSPANGSSFSIDNSSGMLGCNSYVNVGEYQGESRTNRQGIFLAASNPPYPSQAPFFAWLNSGPLLQNNGAFATSLYIEGINEAGGRDLTRQGTNQFLNDPTEQPFLDMWYNNDIRNSTNAFFMIAGQYFDGQPQTPVLVDLITQTYYPIRLHATSVEGQELIALENGMDLANSEINGSMFYINGGLSNPKWIFNTVRLNLGLAVPLDPPLPMLKLPCYNPSIPNIILGDQP